MDALDGRLIDLFTEDPRIGVLEASRRLGVARGTVHARLDRLTRCKDRQGYAFEELVAEIGQCLLFASLGLIPSIDQSAAYVAGWLEALARDKRAIFRAASEAQKAVDFITER